MRFDNVGLFWADYAKVKPAKKEKEIRTPPDPVWLSDTYLPYYEEACAFVPDFYSDEELLAAQCSGERLIYDIESYPNYFSVAFMGVDSGKCLLFELDDENLNFDIYKLKWVMENFLLIDFNGEHYDKYIAAIACAGMSARMMWNATERIIKYKERGYQVLRSMRVKQLNINHIDLIELTALGPSLKKLAARLRSHIMMDLPFVPGTMLTDKQKPIVRWYNFNDLRNTKLVYEAHKKNIALREDFGARYGLDLRSKSDAQMAESIFRAEVQKRTGRHAEQARDRAGSNFKFRMPEWVTFHTPKLQAVKQIIINATFVVDDSGYVQLPKELNGLTIDIGDMTYKMGIGGLHSQESSVTYKAGDEWILRDHDVASYYPKLILGTGMEPPQMIGLFRPIYQGILDARLFAKAKVDGKMRDQVAADGLKITANGTFGKLMDPYSCVYYPELGIQTTISGQLSLLMAIERIELARENGYRMQIINANTDGVVVRCHVDYEDTMKAIFKGWEQETGLEMETSDYSLYMTRDVNNYIAFKTDGEIKSKGIFGKGGVKKDPVVEICAAAVVSYVKDKVPVEKTIAECQDITMFTAMRQAAGGAVKVWPDRTEYIGKVARWYYAKGVEGEIVTANKGHVVGRTLGAKPAMRLDGTIPDDLDRDWYINECYALLEAVGHTAFETTQLTT